MNTLFKFILFALIGIGTFLFYKFTNWRSKIKASQIAERCKQDLEFVHQLLKSLDCPYFKIPFNKDLFYRNIKNIGANFELEQHKILLSDKISQDEYLIIAQCSEMDYNVTLSGRMGKMEKVRQYSFRITFNYSESIIEGFSDLYISNDDKNTRTNFLNRLFQYLALENNN
jgi:hypothetical protein